MWIHSKFRRRKFSLSFTGQNPKVYMNLYDAIWSRGTCDCVDCLQVLYHRPNLYNLCILFNQASKQPEPLFAKMLGRKKHLQPHQTSFCGQAVIRPCQVADSFDLQHGVLRCFTVSVLSGQMRRELSLLTFRRDLSGHGETNWKHDMHESGNANTMENPKSPKKIEKGILGHLILTSRLRWNWRDKRL